MLREIRASNFLLFRELFLAFQDGFHTITGETGAGKSLFIRLLRSFSGCYKAKEMIGPFDERFSVEAVFDSDLQVDAFLDQQQIPTDSRVTMGLAGSSERFSARINGILVPAQSLAALHTLLIEIHSQQAQQNLMNPLYHTHLIDHYALQDIGPVMEQYRSIYASLQKTLQILKHLPADASEIARRKDFLAFQIDEIQQAHLQKGEDGVVERELQLLQNHEMMKNHLIQCHLLLSESVEEPSVQELLGRSLDLLGDVEGFEPEAKAWSKELSLSQEMIQEAGRGLKRYLDSMEFDKERMKHLEERFSHLQRLKKKYGPSLDEVMDYLQRSRSELQELDAITQQAQDVDQTIRQLRKDLEAIDKDLRALRERWSGELETRIIKELDTMKMDRVRFGHQVVDHKDFQAHGRHTVEFIAAANPGLPLQPITKTASGGELSRIFLAIELCAQKVLPVKTIVFDEVDSGIGGRLGELIGHKLRQFSKDGVQVFVVTHLPQVAAMADIHLKVDKTQSDRQTQSTIYQVEGELRDRELQEMMGIQ